MQKQARKAARQTAFFACSCPTQSKLTGIPVRVRSVRSTRPAATLAVRGCPLPTNTCTWPGTSTRCACAVSCDSCRGVSVNCTVCRAQLAGQVGVFAVGFLTPPPARVAEDVDVGRPEGKHLVNTPFATPNVLLVHCPRLIRRDGGHREHGGLIKGGRQPQWPAEKPWFSGWCGPRRAAPRSTSCRPECPAGQ